MLVAFFVTIPVRLFAVPVAVALRPVRRAVDEARPFHDPRAGDPFVAIAAPFPVAGTPDVARTRRGDALEARRWRRHFDVIDDGRRGTDGDPAARREAPAAAFADPFGAVPRLAAMLRFPVAVQPYVAMAVPVPISGRPHIAVARCGDAFKAWRWRLVADDDADADLRHRSRRHEGGGGQRDNGCCVDGGLDHNILLWSAFDSRLGRNISSTA